MDQLSAHRRHPLPPLLVDRRVHGQSQEWWLQSQYTKYSSKGYPILIYLWPYVKALPFQILAIFGLIWLMGRGK